MSIPVNRRRRLGFGLFEADLSARELYKRGLPVPLQDQPFQILTVLLERPGEVVTREELRKKLWPGDTFVDFDEGLNTAIKKLRYALGDSPDNPTFVVTIPRRGYRFIAPVKASDNASFIAPSHAAAVAELTSPKTSRWKLAAAVFGIVLAIALATSLISRIGWRSRSTSTIHSIAVLPLESLSGDASQDYFADGMTDELIADLGQVNALRVISRTSVMQYKNVHTPLPQIARELKVDAVVEGTVLRSGDRVRITAQLIQASSDRHLWAHTYEGDLRDVLGLQNEVAQAVATEVRVRLTSEDRQQLSRSSSVNPKAVDAYLKARYFHAQDGIEALNKSVQYSEEAIKEDPSYAAAHAELSRIYIWLGHTLLLPPHEAFPKAKAAALKAIEIDQTLAEAHADLADVHFLYDWDWSEAEKEFQRAIQLSPSTVSAHSTYSAFLLAMGRPDEAMREAKLAQEVDPFSVAANTSLGAKLYFDRHYDQTIELERRTLVLAPKDPEARLFLGLAYLEKSHFPAALQELQKATEFSGNRSKIEFVGYALGKSGRRAEAQKMLADLTKLSKQTYISPWKLAVIASGLGNNDQTLDYLEKAYAGHEHDMVFSKIWPMFDSVRSDPRYQDLMRRVGLPQ